MVNKENIKYLVLFATLTGIADSAVNLVKYQTHTNKGLTSPNQFEILQEGNHPSRTRQTCRKNGTDIMLESAPCPGLNGAPATRHWRESRSRLGLGQFHGLGLGLGLDLEIFWVSVSVSVSV